LKKLPKSKQAPHSRKFAQSGHPEGSGSDSKQGGKTFHILTKMAVKYINWQYYIPNGHNIYQPFPIQGPAKIYAN
jgi:hypothetical protein